MGNVSKKVSSNTILPTSGWSVKIRQDERPEIGRIVLEDSWYPDTKDHEKAIKTISQDAKTVLKNTCSHFPKGQKVKYLITCGGFIHFPWPDIDTDFDFTNPPSDVIEKLIGNAEKACDNILGARLKIALSKITRFITLGVDSCRDGLYSNNGPHIELVGVFDLEKNKYRWTGKSYPTTHQARYLVRMNLESHFMRLNGDMVMILGCHDLNLFSPRAHAVAGEARQKIMKSFYKLTKNYEPLTVLQHPHTTDTYRVWLQAFNKLRNDHPWIKRFASAGRYENPFGDIPRAEKCGGCEVILDKLKIGQSIDLILKRS